jgi:hypothetical protein
MLTDDYSYDACLRGSVTKAWTVDDCFRGRDFDYDKPFLPERIAGVNSIGCLDGDEKRLLNQIRGNSYCHIFAFVEEWFTQLHYVEHVRDRAELDELFRDILRFHWIDESRHARMDSLLIDEVAGELTTDDRERAIDQLLELGGAVDGLLAQQIELDIDAVQQASGRTFTDDERDEIRTHQRRTYRWTFLVSGLQHPNFVRIVEQLTTTGTAKIEIAARALAA